MKYMFFLLFILLSGCVSFTEMEFSDITPLLSERKSYSKSSETTSPEHVTIELRDGRIIEGDLLREDSGSITLMRGDKTEVTVSHDDISMITRNIVVKKVNYTRTWDEKVKPKDNEADTDYPELK